MEDDAGLNALQANVKSKGANAYYYAHARAKTEQRDYGEGPKKLSLEEAAKLDPTIAAGETAKETRKKRITKFAWGDGKKSVSVYVDFEGVKEDAVSIDWEARRVAVTIRGSADGENDHELILEPLHDDIRDVKVKVKPSKIVLVLKKATADVSWYQLTSKK